jgi:hypothetical protein
MSFDFICKKKSCHGKKAVTFAYDIEKNRIIYQNDENEISHLPTVEVESHAVPVAIEAGDLRELWRRRAEAAVAKPEAWAREELPEALGEQGAARGAAGRQAREDLIGHELVVSEEDDGLVDVGRFLGRHVVFCDQRRTPTAARSICDGL